MKFLKKIFGKRDVSLSSIGLIYLILGSILFAIMGLIGVIVFIVGVSSGGFSGEIIPAWIMISVLVVQLYFWPTVYTLFGFICWKLSKRKVNMLWKTILGLIAAGGIAIPTYLYILQRIKDGTWPPTF